MLRRVSSVMLTAAALLLAGCQESEEPIVSPQETAAARPESAMEEEARPIIAAATLEGREGSGISGAVSLTQQNGQVQIVARVSGVDGPGLHGFHIHQTGDCSAPDFSSAGDHFDPTGAPHGCPDDAQHHAGDLGNIDIDAQGMGNLDVTSDMISLREGASSVLGRAVVLHADRDDCSTQPSGHAGDRLACGVIELVEGEMAPAPGDEGMMDEEGTADEEMEDAGEAI